ncbi:E3 ubiquitin-protein ligase MBR2 [Heracleum sosnowskyi]|uniref:RING-type E3 ubiquitin transferase n=1 Tax=Heracleum sosnowskyi TaxID=360622 RepID=A0AAD8H384_9APIA|nr:E3 ubiquitin-protein ligase MBR2 [Heracleum sosnowskyi]
MDHPSWNNLPAPAEHGLSQNAMSFSSCDFGESSSSANLRDQISGDGLKMEPHRPPSYSASVAETRLEDSQHEPSNSHVHKRVGNDLVGSPVNWEPSSIQNSGSNAVPVNVNPNAGYSEIKKDQQQCVGADSYPSLSKSSTTDTRITPASISFADVEASSGRSGYLVDNDGSGSFPGSCGSPCKRKALEGTSQPYPGENSGLFLQAESTVPGTAHHNASSSLNVSVRTVRSHTANSPVGSSEQVNTVNEVGMGGIPSDAFPPSVAGSVEYSNSDFGPRFSSPSAGNPIRRPNARFSHHSSQPKPNDSSDFRRTTLLPTTSSNSSNRLHLGPGRSLNRNTPFTWNGTHNSRTSSSSSSLAHPRDRGAGLREEANLRGTIRNNVEQLMFVPATETRNIVQDPSPTSMSSGSSSSSAGVASSGQASSSSTSRPSGRTLNPSRLSDFSPWTLFPSAESEAGVSGGHVSPYQLERSSPDEREMPPLGNVQSNPQPYPRHALSREVGGVDVNVRSALAADIQERHRLVSEIRHVLHAMRRGENLQAEDYMLFDTFINGTGALHDRHRDMRLDVDDMSYEDLLALEERMGDVSTGLEEETIMKFMKQRNYSSVTTDGPSKIEPCCICQEEYTTGETIGTLNCGHDFHANCIKQWLLKKNVCPICKTVALHT